MSTLYIQRPGEPHRVAITTNTHADARVRYRVLRNGVATPFFISVPYSMMMHVAWGKHQSSACNIQLGGYTLRLNHKQKTVEGFMPESWFVDLSADEEETLPDQGG